jgi:hypothetical protein
MPGTRPPGDTPYGRGRGRPRTYSPGRVHVQVFVTPEVLQAVENGLPSGMRAWRVNRLLRSHPALAPLIRQQSHEPAPALAPAVRLRQKRPAGRVSMQAHLERDIVAALDQMPDGGGSRAERIERLLETHPEIMAARRAETP